MSIDEIAGIIEAEAGVLDFKGKLAVGQCIVDNRYEPGAFAKPLPIEQVSEESKMAADLAAKKGARRFPNAHIMQFRSFAHYGADGNPDWQKIYSSIPKYYLYLGKDSKGDFGHYYFGKYTKMARDFKLLLIAGHGQNLDDSYDPGACGCGYQEAKLTRELVRLIKLSADRNHLPCDVAEDRNYYDWFKRGGTYDFTPYSYVLEVHFNAGGSTDTAGDGRKKGSMVYIDQDETGHSVEDAILQRLYDIRSVKAWDGVVITQHQKEYKNGLMVQRHVRMQGVSHAVLETCFINDIDDVNWYLDNKQLIATQIIAGIISGFALDKCSDHRYEYVATGIGTAEAVEEMNVRDFPGLEGGIVGLIEKGQRAEILEEVPNGWLKIVWPGCKCGFAYTSNVGRKYYKIIKE